MLLLYDGWIHSRDVASYSVPHIYHSGLCWINTGTRLSELGNSLSAVFYLGWHKDILPELEGGEQ